MHRHWENIILPLIQKIKPKHIVEIGSDTGINTENILKYCKKNNSKLSSIDPKPNFNIDEMKKRYGNTFEFYKNYSLKILPYLENFDIILIDGDHNWYTVFHELKTIENIYKRNKNYPIIILHDIGWPYGRRDLYYDPNTIPPEYVLPYDTLGIIPNEKELSKDKGMNHGFNNALFEGGEKNGVLTAVEDYINQSSLKFSFYSIPSYHGLGILFLENKSLQKIVDEIINYPSIIEDLENHYLKIITSDIQDEKNRLIHKINSENQEINNLIKEKTSLQQINNEQEKQIKTINDENQTLKQKNTEKDKQIKTINDEKTKQKNDLMTTNNALKSEIELKNKELSDLFCINNKQKRELLDLQNTIKHQQEIIDSKNKKIEEYEFSRSWKMTKILRNFSNKLKFNNGK